MAVGTVFGIITAALVASAFLSFFLRKKHYKTFRIIHPLFGSSAAVTGAVHLVLTAPLLKSRPLYLWISGVILLAVLILLAIGGIVKRKGFLKWHRIFAIVAIIVLIGHAAANFVALSEYRRAIASISVQEIDISEIPDGEYIGECDAVYVYAKVRVTVRDGEIEKVEILEHRTECGKAAERIAFDVVREQRIDVDAVTSATNSSKVIKAAIYDALN
jgi:Uncharacterized protein conserved in bacteria